MTSQPHNKTAGYLEVETQDERRERLERLFASQAALDHPISDTNRRADGAPSFPTSDGRAPYRVDPPTALLKRVQAFLPQIHQANEDLDPATANIEDGEDEQGRYIEMMLGLGVFEQRRRGQEGSESPSESSDSSSPSDGDDGDMKVIETERKGRKKKTGRVKEEERGEAFQVTSGPEGDTIRIYEGQDD
ncbi:uncharacterized protein EI90DRAFT_3041951 [Cantharellus anzutake]|uniref:uncharacterized protein n=1 Tax=Cantharellus anzutake TaxID=1750568 RepID=UPI001908BA18|nr:uncharacterized protein EI90DRAFT_3041951 [Cantharellus anzutake]KAF8338178.1 hypothetical protein EI90DRAFT_3041951 [Cantharellus anzutake]